MSDNEAIYDDEISPLVHDIIQICNKHNIPMFMDFQYSDDGFCKSHRATGHPLFNHYNALSQCKEDGGVNIDKYMFWVMKGAKEAGHTSIILSQLDIPVKPNPPREQRDRS